VPPAEAGALFDLFNPAAFVPARVQRILAAAHDQPSWTLEMARKDARLMEEAAAGGGVALALLPALAAAMDRSLAEGLGAKDWMVIARGVTR
jgi:3-hydroxyisobutyrate dehydrogenase